MGHPTGSPKLHMAMTAKRRNKLRKLAEEIPVPEIYGDHEGDTCSSAGDQPTARSTTP